MVAGEWWPADYAGEPLVSFEAEIAKGLGLKIGDTVTVNVLGRNVTARIANLREVKWESLALNFVMVFSPNTLKGAPHNLLATITLPNATPLAAEAQAGPHRSAATFPVDHRHPRARTCIDAFNVSLRQGHGGGARRRQRHPARRCPRAGRRAGDRAAAPHPASRDPQDAGRHAAPHPPLAPRSSTCCWRR